MLLCSLLSWCSMEQVRELVPLDDPDSSLPFIRTILQSLRQVVGSASTVVGFVGSPWTLAAYSIEGSANKYGHGADEGPCHAELPCCRFHASGCFAS